MKKPKDVTRYFGFATVAIEWIGLFICMLLYPTNWAEPVSQFGYYEETGFIFGAALTLATFTCYLYSRHLDVYWTPTSIIMLLAGMSLLVTAWVPYEPYVRTFVFDVHNVATVLALILFSLPMLFLGYQKSHQQIAKFSRMLFFITIFLSSMTIAARVTDTAIIYAQMIAILPLHIWLIITNTLLLTHAKRDTSRQLQTL